MEPKYRTIHAVRTEPLVSEVKSEPQTWFGFSSLARYNKHFMNPFFIMHNPGRGSQVLDKCRSSGVAASFRPMHCTLVSWWFYVPPLNIYNLIYSKSTHITTKKTRHILPCKHIKTVTLFPVLLGANFIEESTTRAL